MNFDALYKKYNGHGMASASGETPEFKAFAAAFKRGLNAEAKKRGMAVVKFNKGHFYVSGFVCRQDERLVYFSVGDMRDARALDKMYYRFALDEKDYSGKGGWNCGASLDRLMDAIAAERFEISGRRV